MEGIKIFGLDETESKQVEKKLKHIFEDLQLLLLKVKREIDKAIRKIKNVLKAAATQVDALLRDAFTVDSFSQMQEGAAIYGKQLALALFSIQTDLDGLRAAIIRAASPIAALFVPVVKQAIGALTDLANSAGKVIRALFGGTEGLDAFTGSANSAVSAGAALKRTLAGFDEINRLGSKDGSGWVSNYIADMDGQMSDRLAAVVAKIRQLLEPLQQIDLKPLSEAFDRLKKALEPITKTLFAGLEWAWHNLLVPLAEWTVEDLLPAFLDGLTEALKGLQRIITELQPAFTWLWENFLKPMAQWAGNSILNGLQSLTGYLGGVGDWVTDNQNPVDNFIASIKDAVQVLGALNQTTSVWNQAGSVATHVADGLSKAALAMLLPMGNTSVILAGVCDVLQQMAKDMYGVEASSNSAWNTVQQDWGGAWEWLRRALMSPMLSGFKDFVNGIIRFINGAIQAAGDAVNTVIHALNRLSFDVPFWIPVIGGNKFGFDLKPVTVPQIPYLAKGAVLPANKPFMAVVGDQKHGTNVEAPLSTIQEAVAMVMQDYAQSNLAGHETTVAVLRQILEAVLGIRIGDDVIANAVDRYTGRMAVVRGSLI